jgi:hypothetical protein
MNLGRLANLGSSVLPIDREEFGLRSHHVRDSSRHLLHLDYNISHERLTSPSPNQLNRFCRYARKEHRHRCARSE